MHEIFWYNGKDHAKSVYTNDIDAAMNLAEALPKAGRNWKVVWMIHTLDQVQPMRGFEKAYEQWKKDAETF